MNMQLEEEKNNAKKPAAGQEAAPQEQPVQEAQPQREDYLDQLNQMLPTLRENKDLVNFAYFMHRQNMIVKNDRANSEWISFRQKVNFCDCIKFRSDDVLMNNASRLGQMYTTNLFPGDNYAYLWTLKKDMPDVLYTRCRTCTGNNGANLTFCPYLLCHMIQETAVVHNVSTEVIFRNILKEEQILFRNTEVARLNGNVPSVLLQGIDAKSAHSAYLLLVSKLISIRSIEEDQVSYSHLMICRGDNKKNLVSDITEFWKTGNGVYGSFVATDKVSLLQTKTEGCKRCEFEQCPHKLAAYFIYLGRKYNEDPIDLAYSVATSHTYGGINPRNNYQFNRYLAAVKAAPMKEESKAEFIKMIHYVVGRKVNASIPFLPFNLAVSSPDKEKATELIADFLNALWYFDYYRCGNTPTNRHLYLSSLTFDDLCQTYEKADSGTTFVLHDIALLCESKDFQAGYHKFLKILEDRRTTVMSVIIAEASELAMFFAAFPIFKKKVFTKSLEMFDMDSDSIAAALVEKLSPTFTIPDEVHQRLDQYIHVSYPASALRSMEYVNDLYEKILFAHYNYDVNASSVLQASDLPYAKPPRSEQEIFEEINQLTGLANVKEELRNINNLVKFNIKMGANNKNAVNLHMMFTGNPGTGKTTVAKLTAEILYSIGFIQENKLVVCSGKDLIAEYMGQTTIKTAKKCEMAYNGVLFIDEAYQLNPYTSMKADTYKEECIAELIQQMENNRDKLVVIFAGYTDEMKDFMNQANTGLRSRIGKVIEFPDYSANELLEIFANIVRRGGMQLDEGAKEKALQIFTSAKNDAQRFGNARYARNLYERSLIQHAAITSHLSADDPALKILRAAEITMPNV